MVYQAIALKLRPQRFEDIIGQEVIVTVLKNSIKLNKISNAYLFAGPRGVGKTTTARIFAKALNCINGPTVEPCQKCNSCIEITRTNSIDVFEIDGASNRGIGEIRELIEKIKYPPSRDRFKIYIIDEVHMLTQEAFNALLKTLEEPPHYVKFIFATTDPGKIPKTILSRCQRFNFKLLPLSIIETHLKKFLDREKIPYEDEAIKLISLESEGSVRDALSLLEQVISFSPSKIEYFSVLKILGLTPKSELIDLIRYIFERDISKVSDIIVELNKRGTDIKKFSILFSRIIKELITLKLKLPSNIRSLISENEEKIFESLIQDIELEYLFQVFQFTLNMIETINRSQNPLDVLEVSLYRLVNWTNTIMFDDILREFKTFKDSLRVINKNIFDEKLIRSDATNTLDTEKKKLETNINFGNFKREELKEANKQDFERINESKNKEKEVGNINLKGNKEEESKVLEELYDLPLIKELKRNFRGGILNIKKKE